MKKTLLIFLFILSSFTVFSQNWINPGATWTFTWFNVGVAGVDRIQYTHDTVMQGKTCQVLRTKREIYRHSGMGTGPVALLSTEYHYNYTYNNGDTVFYYADTIKYGGRNDFRVLYNFAATAGQSWNLGVDTNVYDCGNAFTVVDSVSSVNIGGTPRRVLHVHDSANSSIGLSGWFNEETVIVEGIGCHYFLFPQWRSCGWSIICPDVYSFKCFSDGGTGDYSVVSPGECANPMHLGIDDPEAEDNNLVLYPNPANEEITIGWKNKDSYVLSVYNVLGELLMQESITSALSETVNISELKSGVYSVSLKNKEGATSIKRFVKK